MSEHHDCRPSTTPLRRPRRTRTAAQAVVRRLAGAAAIMLPLAGAGAAARDAAAERVRPAATAAQDTVAVVRNGSRASQRGPSETFTGAVRIDPLFDPNAIAAAGAAWVTFEPGARTAWHAHPRGQRLVVTAGVGRVQRWDGPVAEIRPGDMVWIPAGVKHWHGAAPTTAMTHLAVQEARDGQVVEWMEHVTDTQYAQPTRGAAAR
jgi:quercetin dioxygenase-like cupin family protein